MDPGLEEPPDVAFIKQALSDSTAGGIAPDEVAAIVLDAIIADDFYIPTKPSFTDQMHAALRRPDRTQAAAEPRHRLTRRGRMPRRASDSRQMLRVRPTQ